MYNANVRIALSIILPSILRIGIKCVKFVMTVSHAWRGSYWGFAYVANMV